MNGLPLLRLMQLVSQALPIGGYSHSHGLEAAIEAGTVHDEASLSCWITDLLRFSVGSFEAGCVLDFCAAWGTGDWPALRALNEEFLATRETAELRAASVQMGYSLHRLLTQLPLAEIREPSLPCVWAGAAWLWAIPADAAVTAYLWAWAENQTLVALKAVPLGQSAGQRVLLAAGENIALLVEQLALPAARSAHRDRTRSNFAPALALFSSHHETQYSRLFRS